MKNSRHKSSIIVFAVALMTAASLGFASVSLANYPARNLKDDRYMKDVPTVRGNATLQRNAAKIGLTQVRDDDGCYALESVASSLQKGVFGSLGVNIAKSMGAGLPKKGLANAIVRLPIYDWDQQDGSIRPAHPISGFADRDPKPVGYAKEFDFDITPVPSLRWLTESIKQPKSLAGVSGPVSNWIFYQQAAIMRDSGLPDFRLFDGVTRLANFKTSAQYSELQRLFNKSESEKNALAGGALDKGYNESNAVDIKDLGFVDTYPETPQQREKFFNRMQVKLVRYMEHALYWGKSKQRHWGGYLEYYTTPQGGGAQNLTFVRSDSNSNLSKRATLLAIERTLTPLRNSNEELKKAFDQSKSGPADVIRVLLTRTIDNLPHAVRDTTGGYNPNLPENNPQRYIKHWPGVIYDHVNNDAEYNEMYARMIRDDAGRIAGDPGQLQWVYYDGAPGAANTANDARSIQKITDFINQSNQQAGGYKAFGDAVLRELGVSGGANGNLIDGFVKFASRGDSTGLESFIRLLGRFAGQEERFNTIARNLEAGQGLARDFVEDYMGAIMGRIFGLTGKRAALRVNADGKDLCYEYATAPDRTVDDTNRNTPPHVPSYAFSVKNPGEGIAVRATIQSAFGAIFSMGPSHDGISMHTPGSYNNKRMLHCYGLGQTTTFKLHEREKILKYREQSGLTSLAESLFNLFTSALDRRSERFQLGFWQTIGSGLQLAAVAAEASGASGTSKAVAEVLSRTPVPILTYTNYYNGYFNAYNITNAKDSIVLPDELKDREIDWEKSKLNWMEGIFAESGGEYEGGKLRPGNFWHMKDTNNYHDYSMNGTSFFPHMYIKLKPPHHLKEDVKSRELVQDGARKITTNVKVDKGGFSAGSLYKKESGGASGAIKKSHLPRLGEPVQSLDSKVRVVKTVIKPGYDGSAIRQHDFHQDPAAYSANGGGNAKQLTVNGLEDDSVCRFYKNELGDAYQDCDDGDNNVKPMGGTDPGVRDLAQYDGFTSGNEKNATVAKIETDIPPETAPGTKFCFSLYIDKMSNDIKYKNTRYYAPTGDKNRNRNDLGAPNYNPGYHAEEGKRYLSKAHCVVSGYKPSVQIRGGDVIINGDVKTDTNNKGRPEGHPDAANLTINRTFGSWVEYGLFAKGEVRGGKMASGALYRLGFLSSQDYDEHGYLTFSNAYQASASGNAPNFGRLTKESSALATNIPDGVGRLQAFFGLRADKAQTPASGCLQGNTIVLRDCPSGDYVLRGDIQVDGSGFSGKQNTSLVFFVEDGKKVTIKSDITVPETYQSIAELSQVVFTSKDPSSKYLLEIEPQVRNVDAWILNPKGAINTCKYSDGSAGLADTPRAFIRRNDPSQKHPCYENTLMVNGPVAAANIYLRRSGGEDQNRAAGTELKQSISGEIFNLRPDSYLWAVNQVTAAGRKFTTTRVIDLPPRY